MEKYIPKVGDKCQIHIRGGKNIEKQFIDVTIVFYGLRYVVAKDKNGREYSRKIANVELKPIPTEEESLKDELLSLMNGMIVDHCSLKPNDLADKIIKAGYRKVEPISYADFRENISEHDEDWLYLCDNNHIIAK